MSEESTAPDLVELAGLPAEAPSRRDFDAFFGYYAAGAVWDMSRMGAVGLEE